MYASLLCLRPLSPPPTPMGPLFRADHNLRSGDGPPAICQSRSEEHAVAPGIICQCAPGFLHELGHAASELPAHPSAGSPLLKQPPTLAAPRSYFPCPPVIINRPHRSAGPGGWLQPPLGSAGSPLARGQRTASKQAQMTGQVASKRLSTAPVHIIRGKSNYYIVPRGHR